MTLSIQASSGTQIRIQNDSEFNFTDVQVGENNFGDIDAGSYSDYKLFDIAYEYNYVKLYIKGKEFIIQPIDYVGETPLGAGKFTYILRVVDYKKRVIDIDFRADKDQKTQK